MHILTHLLLFSEYRRPSAFVIPFPHTISPNRWELFSSSEQQRIASHYGCETISKFEDNYLHFGKATEADAIPPLPPPPPLENTNTTDTDSDEAIAEVLGEELNDEVAYELEAPAHAETAPSLHAESGPTCVANAMPLTAKTKKTLNLK